MSKQLNTNKCFFQMGYPDCSKKLYYANLCQCCSASMKIVEFDKIEYRTKYGTKSDPNCFCCRRNSEFIMGQKILCENHYNHFK